MLKEYFRSFMVITMLTVSLLWSCNGKNDELKPLGVGQVKGAMRVVGALNKEKSDFSGVKVSLIGSDPLLTTLSNSEGHFKFDKVPAGTYHIKYEKEGFFDYMIPSISHVGGSIPTLIDFTTVIEEPEISVKHIEVSIDESFQDMPKLKINYVLDKEITADKNNHFVVLINKGDSVNNINYKYYYSFYSYEAGSLINNVVNLPWGMFKKGDKLSIIAAGYSLNNGIKDPETGKQIVYGISPRVSNKVEVTL